MGSSLQQLIKSAGLAPDSRPAAQLEAYLALLVKWNSRINLTASTDWQGVGPLFEEAFWAAHQYPLDAVRHLDIGSGAGFPALLLRILIPRMRLDLVESRARRCFFLETAACDLGLEGTCVINDRLQGVLAAGWKDWDCVSWKALKLSTRDLRTLAARANERTRFWMFHGREPAVEDTGVLDELFVPQRREPCPARPGWWLSEFRKAEGAGTREQGPGAAIY